MRSLEYYRRAFYERLLASQSENPNARRHEFMLNVILCGVVSAYALATICALADKRLGNDFQQGTTPFNMCTLLGIMLGLWWLSRAGKHTLAAYALLACMGFTALNLMLTWNFELPTAALGCAALIVIAGIILEARAALRVTIVTTICFLAIAHAQIFGHLHPHSDWLNKRMAISDAIDYGLLLSVIGLVSWLANLEIDRSLERARTTETALACERDSLEIKVAERTSELEQMQQTRLLELQRFAEFGRVSASLLHEVANPLTAASLNLEQLGRQQSRSVRQARKSLWQLERYVTAARKQLQDHSQPTEFDTRQEIRHLLAMLRPVARKAGIQLVAKDLRPVKLFGDAVKFNQIIANIVVNAVDAGNDTVSPRVTISAKQQGNYLHIMVQDWGAGISAEQLPRIFEPFYTSKANNGRGLGIGLAMVKQSVEQDFAGSIKVESSPGNGTLFVIKLRLQAPDNNHLLVRPGQSTVSCPNQAGLVAI